MLARGGVVAIVGNRGVANHAVDMRDLMNCEGSIVGVLGGRPEEHAQSYAHINAMLANGAIVPVVGPRFELAEAPAAQTEVMEHAQGSHGKVVILPFGAEAAAQSK